MNKISKENVGHPVIYLQIFCSKRSQIEKLNSLNHDLYMIKELSSRLTENNAACFAQTNLLAST